MEALLRYHQRPHICQNCFKKIEVGNKRVADVIKKKFCNYSCSSQFQNRKRREALDAAPASAVVVS